MPRPLNFRVKKYDNTMKNGGEIVASSVSFFCYFIYHVYTVQMYGLDFDKAITYD